MKDTIDDSKLREVLIQFYRAEMRRISVWRKRLDSTTNWSVIVTAGILTFVFSNPNLHHIILLLGIFLILIFLVFESRRYRFYDVWRSRIRLLEDNLISSALKQDKENDKDWEELLYRDLQKPKFKITHTEAISRRLRRIYLWIFSIFFGAWFIKLGLHPVPFENLTQIVQRASIGPLPGIYVVSSLIFAWILLFGLAFYKKGKREAKGEIRKRDDKKYDWKKEKLKLKKD